MNRQNHRMPRKSRHRAQECTGTCGLSIFVAGLRNQRRACSSSGQEAWRANEHGKLLPSGKKGKPVFHAECGQGVSQGVIAVNTSLYCDKTTVAEFSNVIERKELEANPQFCPRYEEACPFFHLLVG